MKASREAGFRRFRGGHIQKEQLLLQFERVEVGVLGASIEARTVLGDPGQVAVTEDDGIGIVDLQAAKQVEEDVYHWGLAPVIDFCIFNEENEQ